MLVLPEGCRAILSGFEEEMRGDWFYRLDEMLADGETADDICRKNDEVIIIYLNSFWANYWHHRL